MTKENSLKIRSSLIGIVIGSAIFVSIHTIGTAMQEVFSEFNAELPRITESILNLGNNIYFALAISIIIGGIVSFLVYRFREKSLIGIILLIIMIIGSLALFIYLPLYTLSGQI